ncbi:WecB/TagA/CpsF family glycosyltransferase [bacterium]|nr:WecB/TagA/CpsF family glycosyltransferase [bacterium]
MPTEHAGTPAVAVSNILGVAVAALDLEGAVDLVIEAVTSRRRGYVCVCGAHGLIECQSDPELRRIHNQAMAVVADGMPLVWALHGNGHPDAGRVYGPDLMRAVFARGTATGLRHFLYGTTPKNLLELEMRLRRMYPGCQIVGAYAPPFRALTAAEEDEVGTLINAARAEVVWVGLSTPKQERWMARMRDRLEAPILLGVGAAFDFIGGNKAGAPKLLQRAGLEWAYRLLTEPRRLWRRYARVVPGYLALRMLQKTGLRSFPIAEAGSGGATPVPRTVPDGLRQAGQGRFAQPQGRRP